MSTGSLNIGQYEQVALPRCSTDSSDSEYYSASEDAAKLEHVDDNQDECFDTTNDFGNQIDTHCQSIY